MNAKATLAYERITKLLDEAAQDGDIPVDDFRELLEDVSDFCESGVEVLAEEASEAEASEGAEGGDHADESDIDEGGDQS